MSKKVCICGRSSRYPLCDGSHANEGWTCRSDHQHVAPMAFVASPHLRNVADRLAHRFDGISAHIIDAPLKARLRVVITDGTGLAEIRQRCIEVHAPKTLVMGVGVPASTLRWAFPEADVATVPAEPATSLWDRVQASLVRDEVLPSELAQRPCVFVSHAVSDEPAIYPALTTLRQQYGLELFVCADSIAAGTDWHHAIVDHLRRCDLFLVVASHASGSSLFCAFEAGMAVALNKPVRVVLLDDATLPAYVSGLQAVDVPRLMKRKPWLDTCDAVLDACLTAIAGR